MTAEHDRLGDEQYRLWVASRWDVELEGGEGFRAIHRLLGSAVEYRRVDAFELDRLDERFDLVYCFGILHRVENPLGLLRVLRGRTASGRDWSDAHPDHLPIVIQVEPKDDTIADPGLGFVTPIPWTTAG